MTAEGWTDERVELLKRHWENGLSCTLIAEAIGGITKNAVIGKVHRLKLKPRRTRQRVTGWHWYSRAERPSKKSSGKKWLPPITRSNFTVAGPAPRAKPVVVALPVKGVSDADLVAGWLAQNGEPRRFRRGDSGDPWGLKFYLRDRGFEMTYTQKQRGMVTLVQHGMKGRPKTMIMRELVAFVDAIRRAEGLEPLAA
jgi:hypothetical protein